MKRSQVGCAAMALALLACGAWGQGFLSSANHVEAKAYLSRSAARPGDTVAAAVVLDIKKGYHINAHKPTLDYLIPTVLSLEAPDGIRAGAIRYPKPQVRKFDFSEEPLAVYEGKPVLRFDLEVDAAASTAARELKGKVRVQACDERACYAPANLELSIAIPMAAKGAAVQPTHPELFR